MNLEGGHTWIPVEKARQLAGKLQKATVEIIPEAGHLVIEEKPDALLKQMRVWLAD